MKQILAPSLIALLVAAPSHAEDTSDGLSLMEEGARMFLRGMMDQAEPALRDLQELAEGMEPAMRQFVQQMGPALRDLLAQVDDLTAYEAPEMLPNGDIIMRRKPAAPDVPQPPGEGAIDL